MTTLKIIKALIPLLVLSGISYSVELPKEPLKNFHAELISMDSTRLNGVWKQARNNGDSSLIKLYTPDAIKVISYDSVLIGPDEIFKHYRNEERINYISTAYTVKANPDRGIIYEVNHYKTNDGIIHIQLVIYEQHDDKTLRAFEYEGSSSYSEFIETPQQISEQIKARRDQWMKHCNAHDVPELVYDLYSHNTLYYNHRPLVKGRQALVREYAYMNNEQYSLSLHPRHVNFVNETTVIEIGQCEGSYNGKYILIWKKEEDGVWRIFIDSNV